MNKSPSLLCSKRLNLALVCFLGCAIAYTLRSNLSFAIICMVDEDPSDVKNHVIDGTKQLSQKGCPREHELAPAIRIKLSTKYPSQTTPPNSTITTDERVIKQRGLGWSKSVQGTVLSAFFWGYLTSQVLGGYMCSLIGAKRVILGTIALSSALTLLSPFAARLNVFALVAIRVLVGFAQGSLFPAMHSLWSRWAPPLERGLLTGISYAGCQIGNVVVMPLSGLLCHYGFDGGWPSIFYLLGALGLVWCVLWHILAADSPQSHREIRETERQYIVGSLGECGQEERHNEKRRIPFVAIITSPAVWAIFAGHFAGDWGAYTMAVGLPSFMNDVLGLDMASMGVISAIPYVFYFLAINLGGLAADQLQTQGFLSTLNTRRLAMILGALGGQALFLLLIGYSNCGQEALVIILLTLSIGISGLQYSGFVINYLDICPQYAGIVLGIGNTLSCMAGVISPLIIGVLTPTGSKEEWLSVFYVACAVLVAGAVIFSAFARGEVQSWAVDKVQFAKNLPTQLDEPLLHSNDNSELIKKSKSTTNAEV